MSLRGSNPSVSQFFHDMRNCFTPFEWKVINTNDESKTERVSVGSMTPTINEYEQLKQFYINWTLKEGYIKAVGIGLGFELQRAEFYQDEEKDKQQVAVVEDDDNNSSHKDTLYYYKVRIDKTVKNGLEIFCNVCRFRTSCLCKFWAIQRLH